MKNESQKRSVVKSLTWRVIATVTTILIAYLLTGNILIATSIGAVEVVAKLLMYYLHDRIWNNVSWGVVDD